MSERSETKRPALQASVIIPSYRGEQRLPELLERLTRQDFEGAWEVVVALDGEDDGSRAVLETYRDRLPLTVIASEESRGVAATLNGAYEVAQGEVLIRCDDDLSPEPHMVRRHVELHASSDVPLGVIGATRDVFADTPYARAYGIPANRRHLATAYKRDETETWVHWAAHNSVTRETWDRFGRFDTSFAYGEDGELGFRLREAGVRIVIAPELEIVHRGPAPSAGVRITRAFVSGASRHEFERAHPGTVRPAAAPGSLAGNLWNGAVGALAASVRSQGGYRRYGRAIDGLRSAVPAGLRGRLIALGVEAAGRSGYRNGAEDLRSESWRDAHRSPGFDGRTHREAVPAPNRGVPEQPMRTALWIVPVADLGGVARHVLDATRVGIPGWRVVVLCPEGPLAERLREQGAAVTTGRFGPDAGPVASMRTLRRTAAALRPDIVHSHLAYADIINAWTRLPRGTRRFTTEHGIAGDDGVYHHSSLQSRVMAFVHRARFPRFDGVIAVAEATKRAMIQKWHVTQPITVILNGVDLPEGVEPRDPSTVTGTRILSLSRLAPEKRIDKLIEAFALVKKERPEATLTIAGEGPLRAELERRSSRIGLADAVRFPGFMDPDEAMADADVLVQLSIWENCSYTLLDAVARGLRVVAADVGGNHEIVGRGGLLDQVDSLTVSRALLSADDGTLGAGRILSRDEMCDRLASRYSGDGGDEC
ncbi:glycosyltransferase [Microbacterium sp. USTB-Y]|uniref:glycosyltransferase n=1 Tax=Microbacterium sp. USTB-Y TaxID=2823692 RepID=UPI00203C9D38|nr:glycosyltransferase [Microbacterium sp. USTB-Y]